MGKDRVAAREELPSRKQHTPLHDLVLYKKATLAHPPVPAT